MVLSILPLLVAYGEGNADIVAPASTKFLHALAWAPSAEVQPCAVLHPGSSRALVQVSLPAEADELDAPEVCVRYTTRPDKALNWWFVAPPPADSELRACAPSRRDGPVMVALDVALPLGFTRVIAVLEQPRSSTTALVAPIDAVVAVVEGDDRPAWLRPTQPQPSLSEGALAALREGYHVVRADERAEKEAYARRTAEGRAAYQPLHAWEAHSTASTHALKEVLSPALLAALEAPTPAGLWRLVHTPAAGHPVHQLQLFSAAGAERIASELDAAHHAMLLRNARVQPTNNMSSVSSSTVPLAENGNGTAVATGGGGGAGRPSILLDEVGLHAVAHALAAAVLAPLARLLLPEWSVGGALDSYHAFTIHRHSAATDQVSWFHPSSNSEPGSGRRAPALNATTESGGAAQGRHSDVCEVSLNVALRVSDDLEGSRVGFEPLRPPAASRNVPDDAQPAACDDGFAEPAVAKRDAATAAAASTAAAVAEVLWVGHSVGRAFINVCQQRHGVEPLLRGSRDTLVVRGFASQFRRAPAEGFYEQCVANMWRGRDGKTVTLHTGS